MDRTYDGADADSMPVQSGMTAAISDAYSDVGILEDMITVLEKRLAPILLQPTLSDAELAGEKGGESEYTEAVRGLAQRTREAYRALNDIIHRINL